MIINLESIDLTQFMVHPHVIGGQVVSLVQPQHIGTKWTQDNKVFRSSVWDSNGELVSAGFPKFTNWGENPEHFPTPRSLYNTHVVEKMDGSLLIVSRWNGNIILRTRGTVDAIKLDNGYELELFKEKYLPQILSLNSKETWDYSLLFEWVSPNQRIVINYGDSPEWYLVGGIYHDNYSLFSQSKLDHWAETITCPRPPVYTFPTVNDLMENVEKWKGKEGVIVYSNDGQNLHKIKGLWYLALHRMKESLSSVEKVVDAWFEQGMPSFPDMQKFIINQFDWELWTQVQGDISRICDAWKDVQSIVEGMNGFVEKSLKPLPNRKEQAIKVLNSYGQTNRASFVFKLLDNKPLAVDDYKKLLYQCLKK